MSKISPGLRAPTLHSSRGVHDFSFVVRNEHVCGENMDFYTCNDTMLHFTFAIELMLIIIIISVNTISYVTKAILRILYSLFIYSTKQNNDKRYNHYPMLQMKDPKGGNELC